MPTNVNANCRNSVRLINEMAFAKTPRQSCEQNEIDEKKRRRATNKRNHAKKTMFKVIADIVDWLPKNAVQRIDKKITFSNYLKSKIGAHDRSKVINKLQTEAETIEKYFHFVVAPTQWNHQISRVCLYTSIIEFTCVSTERVYREKNTWCCCAEKAIRWQREWAFLLVLRALCALSMRW